jgi:hypothetical protein
MYGRSTTAWPNAAQVDVSTFHEIESAVSIADDPTRPNNTNVPGADLHATLASRVLGVIPTDEDGGDAPWG